MGKSLSKLKKIYQASTLLVIDGIDIYLVFPNPFLFIPKLIKRVTYNDNLLLILFNTNVNTLFERMREPVL